MDFLEIVGMVVTVAVVLFFLLYILYGLLKKKAEPAVDLEAMPNLKPIPIPTRNRPWGMRILVWFFEVRRWRLSDNWIYELKDGTRVILHEGFQFDGASIPRPFWGLLSPTGLLLIPGLVHDYGYKHDQLWQLDDDGQVEPYGKGNGKGFWDELFLQVGRDVNGFKLINFVAWLGVALGGSGAWKGHRETDADPVKPQV